VVVTPGPQSSERPNVPADSIGDFVRLSVSVLRRARRYWPVFAFGVVLGIAAFVLVPRFLKPVYRSEVALVVRAGLETGVVLGAEAGQESPRSRNARLQSLVFSRPNLRALIELERLNAKEVAMRGMAPVMDDLARQISFVATEGNSLVIRFEDVNPDVAQRVAHRLAQLLVEQTSEMASERARATRKFLEGEVQKLGEELHERDAEYADFVTAHPEFAIDRLPGAAPGAAAARALAVAPAPGTSMSDPAAALRRQSDRLRRKLDQIRSPTAAAPRAPAAPPEPTLSAESRQAIAAAEADVRRARDELEQRQTKFTARHPDVVAAHSRYVAAQDRLARVKAAAVALSEPAATKQAVAPVPPVQPDAAANLERQLRNVESAIRSAGSAESQPSTGTENNAQAIANLETQWAALTRMLDAARERYESMQRRLFQAIVTESAQSMGGGSELVVTDDAYYPKQPSKRGPIRTGAVGFLMAVALGTLVALGLGYLDPRLVCEWDLTRLGIAPINLVVPRLDSRAPKRARG
jgi:succinoglycan biosynthesis transport protein ExoP